ncbi:hypothetical protein DV451_003667 [Geotrichum candidum]|uniref:Trehalase n=1 Tax=Geotrichum candidum TaxID=1173061 RepID=A0A9P5KTA1_GEOCN|nr:hypothetical protein DV451_003667 [Geotrichum candidum]
MDPLSTTPPDTTYDGKRMSRARTFSTVDSSFRQKMGNIRRRGSQDTYSTPRVFLVNVDKTLERLLANEDTDRNFQITIQDSGPKVLSLGTANSNGFNQAEIRGTYMLSNLLQELTMAQRLGKRTILIDEDQLNENPVTRLSRLIKTRYWDSLTRRIDASMIDVIATDTKDRSPDARPRIYIPASEVEQYEYYTKIAKSRPELKLEINYLPKKITPEWVKSINDKPGLLALAMESVTDPADGKSELQGVPYVVPGGRFNELYGWDSYMMALGLLVDDKTDLAIGIVENFIFEIEHYGKILNANRTYYLCRSQPPFLTDLTLRVFDKIKHTSGALDFLERGFIAAIKEYKSVWTSKPRLDPKTGLSRYRPEGLGIPPETEPTHFIHLLQPYADKYKVSFDEFQRMYNDGEIKEPELDEYFLHDRAVRESGHDTSYRLEGQCADLATIDLNSLLYKYESDIAHTIRTRFNDKLRLPDGSIESSAIWDRRMRKRKAAIDKHLWNEKAGMFFDYDTKKEEMSTYVSATTFWAMWAGVASPRQAYRMIEDALPQLEELGGLAAGTEDSRGPVGLDRPNRQWDYPYGWAPQQILAWDGFLRYGYEEETTRLVYKWLYMITRAFVDYNGVVVEKYNVTDLNESHKVDAEYGNQGLDFKGVATEGFGWVNASYTYGLTLLSSHAVRALGALTPTDVFFNSEKIE